MQFEHGQLVRLKVDPTDKFVVLACSTAYHVRNIVKGTTYPVMEHEIVAAESIPAAPIDSIYEEATGRLVCPKCSGYGCGHCNDLGSIPKADTQADKPTTVTPQHATIRTAPEDQLREYVCCDCSDEFEGHEDNDNTFCPKCRVKPINNPTDPFPSSIARCEVCDWPLASDAKSGCVPGDCAYRPNSQEEQQRIAKRRAELAAKKMTAGDLRHFAKQQSREQTTEILMDLANREYHAENCIVCSDAPDEFDKDEALEAFAVPDVKDWTPEKVRAFNETPISDYFTPPEATLPLFWIDNVTESETTDGVYQVDQGPNGWTAYYFSEPGDHTPDLESDYPFKTREAAKCWCAAHHAGEELEPRRCAKGQ